MAMEGNEKGYTLTGGKTNTDWEDGTRDNVRKAGYHKEKEQPQIQRTRAS